MKSLDQLHQNLSEATVVYQEADQRFKRAHQEVNQSLTRLKELQKEFDVTVAAVVKNNTVYGSNWYSGSK